MSNDSPVERIALRPAEAAQALGVHRATIYKWMDSGYLPSVVKGRARFILMADLTAWMRERG
jgi:excisionase family DNA binding protein